MPLKPSFWHFGVDVGSSLIVGMPVARLGITKLLDDQRDALPWFDLVSDDYVDARAQDVIEGRDQNWSRA